MNRFDSQDAANKYRFLSPLNHHSRSLIVRLRVGAAGHGHGARAGGAGDVPALHG